MKDWLIWRRFISVNDKNNKLFNHLARVTAAANFSHPVKLAAVVFGGHLSARATLSGPLKVRIVLNCYLYTF
jgi:hypothetical protein